MLPKACHLRTFVAGFVIVNGIWQKTNRSLTVAGVRHVFDHYLP